MFWSDSIDKCTQFCYNINTKLIKPFTRKEHQVATVIQFQPQSSGLINVSKIQQESIKIKTGLIAPAIEDVSYDLAPEHAAEPIKSMEDVNRISQYLIDQRRWRDNMLFIVGINFGLRVSDLRLLRFSHLINDNFTFKTSFAILETKTRNTRKVQKNRHISINEAVRDAVLLYLENTPNVHLSDYMFRCEGNRAKNQNQPIHRNSVDRILKGIGEDLDLPYRMATHTLRKTFAFHQMVMSNNDPRKLLLLQKMFGHSTSAQTLEYIGITSDEIVDAYQRMNLGSKTSNYLVDGVLYETEVTSA